VIVSKAISIEKGRITLNIALFCDLSPDKRTPTRRPVP
jgi:hypothetical protein